MKGINFQATLEAVQAAPYQALTILSSCNGVVSATAKLGDTLTGERLDDGGLHNGSFVITSTIANGCCAEAVQAPGIDFSVRVNREGMVGATANVRDILREPKLAREQPMELIALNDAAAELVLLSRAPRENAAFVVQRKDVVRATRQVLDLFQGRNEDWSVLNPMGGVKAENSVIALSEENVVSAKPRKKKEKRTVLNLLGKFPSHKPVHRR